MVREVVTLLVLSKGQIHHSAGLDRRPPRHGTKLILREAHTHPQPVMATCNDTARYGQARAVAFARIHPRLNTRSGWSDHEGELPIIEGTIMSLNVEYLPGDRAPTPVWLWVSKPVPDSGAEVDHWWSMFIRRFDLEHTFRFLKQTLGWTKPRLQAPDAADRWTWLIIAAHTQLRLARPLVADHRLPWQPPLAPDRLTPARVRAGYRGIHRMLVHPAGAPKGCQAPGFVEGHLLQFQAA